MRHYLCKDVFNLSRFWAPNCPNAGVSRRQGGVIMPLIFLQGSFSYWLLPLFGFEWRLFSRITKIRSPFPCNSYMFMLMRKFVSCVRCILRWHTYVLCFTVTKYVAGIGFRSECQVFILEDSKGVLWICWFYGHSACAVICFIDRPHLNIARCLVRSNISFLPMFRVWRMRLSKVIGERCVSVAEMSL